MKKTVLAIFFLLAGDIMQRGTLANSLLGMCSSLANPAVSAATAAAGGVLTPQPCSPVLTAPWMPGSLTVQIGGKSALNNTSKLMCSYGGVIQVSVTPAMTVKVP